MLSLLALMACTKTEPIEEVFTGCDPLDETRCLLPFPSTYHMVEDADQVSGWKVNIAEHAMPENRDDYQMSPRHWNEKDGFSTLSPVVTFFPDLDPSDLPGHENIAASLADDSPIALINAETGELVPFFAEVDVSGETATQRLLMIRPMEPMEHGARYVVGIRNLKKQSGGDVDVSDAFAALRDGTETDTWDVEGRRGHFDDEIFPVLEGAGWERSELQLAWDFVTLSKENSLGRVMWMRDDATERVGATGPAYTVTEIEEGDCEGGATIGRTVYVDLTVPMYTESEDPGTFLTRDENGQPFYNGETTAQMMVRIPCSLLADPEPAMVVQYGHGLFGDLGEARTGYLSQMANDYKWVVIASDWVGMSESDVKDVTLMLALEPGEFAMLPERSMQGFVQMDMALRAVRGDLGQDEALSVDGASLIDPDRVTYYGNSQGGILGPAYVGMSGQLERAVFGVAGGPYTLLLSRSADFDPFFLIFKAKFPDQIDISLTLTLMQTLWDVSEGSGWTRALNQEPFEGEVAKQVLIQNGIGDAQVTTLGGQVLARSFGANSIAPETRPVWGIEEKEGGFTGSGFVEWYYADGSTEPVENIPPEKEGDTHDCPRKEPAAHEQLRDFLETGVINQYCVGTCEGLIAETCP
jgi:hypothetical protein